MNLQLLCSVPHLALYFDSWNNWLYVEWEGDLTLAVVQLACLELAQCFMQHAYPRVLISNAGVTNVSPKVSTWLATHVLPWVAVVGIEQVAWVHAPSVQGYELAEQSVHRLHRLRAAFFSDVEQATVWLQRLRPAYVSGCELRPRPVAAHVQQLLNTFQQTLIEMGVLEEAPR